MWWRKEENCVYRGGDSPTLLSSLRNVFVSSTCPPIPLAVCQIPVLLGRLPDPVLWTDCPDPLGRLPDPDSQSCVELLLERTLHSRVSY